MICEYFKMAPHKQSAARANSKQAKFEQIQADHELFLQAFEKPTQIYRFLAARNKISPIYLNRTLSYLRKRCKRSTSCRSRLNFKFDDLVEKLDAKKNPSNKPNSIQGDVLNINFDSLRIPQEIDISSDQLSSTVEVILLKVCHRRRKNVQLPAHKSLATVDVPIHTLKEVNGVSQEQPNGKSISLSSSSLGLTNGHRVKTYILLLKVACPSHLFHRHDDSLKGDGRIRSPPTTPSPKRRRLSSSSPEKISSPNRNGNHPKDQSVFYTELVLVDKSNKCQLTDGDYDVTLQEIKPPAVKSQRASWEAIHSTELKECLDTATVNPSLRFSLNWTSETVENGAAGDSEIQELPCTPPRSLSGDSSPSSPASSLRNGNTTVHENNNGMLPRAPSPRKSQKTPVKPSPVKCSEPDSPRRVYYQFLYNSNLRQQTEARDNLRCPWCALNCMDLYGLLKHLTLSHSRFNFNYVPHVKGARIDVTINEHYDGSYAGNPHNLTSHTGYAFHRNGPCRRTPVTLLLVTKPQRLSFSLQEFQDGDNKEFLSPRPFISGHNRLYYHTHTLQPIRPQEMDVDSEDEIDPEWMKERTKMMIDEFTDVNEGEKELMKLWNLHCMKHNFIADSQILHCCLKFVNKSGREVLQRGLYRNFLLHLVNLYDFSLLHPQLIVQVMNRLDQIREEMEREREVDQRGVETFGGCPSSSDDPSGELGSVGLGPSLASSDLGPLPSGSSPACNR